MAVYCRTFSLSRPFLAPHKPRVRRSTAISASSPARGSRSVFDTRLSLVLSLASQASTLTQRRLGELAEETAKYAFPRRFESKSLEESLMSVPDLETVKYRVLKRTELYEIREVEPYFIAETKMPGKTGFDFNGASQSFNTLASYLFGKNIANEQMEMTTPVYTTKIDSNNGEKMNMTTPVITKKDKEKWLMSFVIPSKYGSNIPLPRDKSVIIKKVPQKIIAICAFSGFVTDEDVNRRESKLRQALKTDPDFKLKDDTLLEIAQFNPPFTLPFTRRNEISLEVEMTSE